MTIFLKEKMLHKDKAANEDNISLLSRLVSFEFPERHTKDFLKASRVYYDPNPQQSNIGVRIKELST